ncbi:MAG TPA: hypothetical protein VMB81_07115 [Candidatus Sulfotelmatobacter sp.]|nr:hypothetical protein [Candidatus Sulfotelmatobacter sp.]
MGHRGILNSIRVAAALCLLLTGCLAPPSVVSVPPSDTPINLSGILPPGSAPEANDPIRILFIHGIGADATNYCLPVPLMLHLAKVLGAQPQTATPPWMPPKGSASVCSGVPVPEPIQIRVTGAPDPALLFHYRLDGDGGKRTVDFWFLLWAPLTQTWKETPSVMEDGHPPWAVATELAKGFMQTHLTDVVLYGGTYRAVMRPSVEAALCYVVGGQPDPADPNYRDCDGGTAAKRTVVITHSMGGYMLFDAVADLKAHHSPGMGTAAPASHPRDASAKLLSSTDQVFMLANQLALLDLTTATAFPSAPGDDPAHVKPLRAFADRWKEVHDADPTRPRRGRQIVAISDPNDLLSFVVTAGAIDVSGGTTVANVYLGTAPDWFGLFASPASAHNNYLTDTDVMDIIACGMSGNRILRCTP